MLRGLTELESARSATITLRTWQRLVASGQGPVLTHISQRRRIVLEDDNERWLRSRRRPIGGDDNGSTAAA
jgi:hypothetical protein